MSLAIQAQSLSKKYRYGGQAGKYKTLREDLINLALRPFRSSRKESSGPTHFWALKDASFQVNHGEAVGLIGPNGAGKSTLLKILSRITPPTRGSAVIHGRVGSLLEVGTGFHPELTGRENIFLSGTILGMRRAEVAQRLDEIVAFSEIERFLDTPVKHYSSGMYVRLAFAVAAHLETEILLIDEVLAVGDIAFQQKCLGKMGEVTRRGRTIVFVSHNMAAIERICERCLVIDQGKIVADGSPDEAIGAYLSENAGGMYVWRRDQPTEADAFFTEISLRDEAGKPVEFVRTDTDPVLNIEYRVRRPRPRMCLSIGLLDQLGSQIFRSAPIDCGAELPKSPGTYHWKIRFPEHLLLARHYKIFASLWEPIADSIDNIDKVDQISVPVEAGDTVTTLEPRGRPGIIAVRCKWELVSSAGSQE